MQVNPDNVRQNIAYLPTYALSLIFATRKLLLCNGQVKKGGDLANGSWDYVNMTTSKLA